MTVSENAIQEPTQNCPKCGAFVLPAAIICPACSQVFERKDNSAHNFSVAVIPRVRVLPESAAAALPEAPPPLPPESDNPVVCEMLPETLEHPIALKVAASVLIPSALFLMLLSPLYAIWSIVCELFRWLRSFFP